MHHFRVMHFLFLIKSLTNNFQGKICDSFNANSHFKNDYFCENPIFVCQLTFLHSIQRKI